ncbi:MAG: tetratricopeptide repeat protein, partial [Betaproteobacteria bacterium]|nr:tetratricopeptide repeat protein [Betaproteobacteria bacterium]
MLALMRRRFFLGCILALALAGCQTLPEQIDSTMKEGQTLYAQKNYNEAIARFSEALSKDPKHFPAHVWIARVQMAKGDWGAAVASARKAREIAPKGESVVTVLSEALLGAGTAALKAGKSTESIPLFLEYIELQPTHPAAYLNVARAYLGEKRFAEALAALSRALGIPSDSAMQREALELLLDGARRALAEGDLASMIRFLSEYLKIDPANLGAWLDLARGYLKTGNYGEAVAAFAGGLKQDGSLERGPLLRELLDAGNQALSSGRLREGAAMLREYVAHDRGNIEVLLRLARASWSAGERMQALDALRQIKEVNP